MEEEILAAAKAANALECIQVLSHGLETQVAERGTMLSGGTKAAHWYGSGDCKKGTELSSYIVISKPREKDKTSCFCILG
ncbi:MULTISPECIES: hypothetical protein [Bartonella]|uniref:hypothetical protein n=1 Tax=Bartonella TaxID=773 RepID=UPI0038577207